MSLQTKSDIELDTIIEKQTKSRWSTCLSFLKKLKRVRNNDNLSFEIMDQKDLKTQDKMKESNPSSLIYREKGRTDPSSCIPIRQQQKPLDYNDQTSPGMIPSYTFEKINDPYQLPPPLPLPSPPFSSLLYYNTSIKQDLYEVVVFEEIASSVGKDKACYDAIVSQAMRPRRS